MLSLYVRVGLSLSQSLETKSTDTAALIGGVGEQQRNRCLTRSPADYSASVRVCASVPLLYCRTLHGQSATVC
eukprot:SAG11_NODE_33066_length_279_cov_0.850000_1_plen_72_part_10